MIIRYEKKNVFIHIKNAFIAALKTAAPIMAGFIFLGVGYGIYMTGYGFSCLWPGCMAAAVYAGSVEFIVVSLLLSTFNPLYVFIITLFVNGRHIFYGISILKKYQTLGWKKFFLICGLSDEAFSINYMTEPKNGILYDWYMLWVTVLLYLSWVAGSFLGGFAGNTDLADIRGIEFVMPALFIVIFINQWQQEKSHISSILGLIIGCVCLILFGETYFLLPTLFIISFIFSVKWILAKNKINYDGLY